MTKKNEKETGNENELTQELLTEESVETETPAVAETVVIETSEPSIPFYKKRWAKIAGLVASALLILGIGAAIGAEIADGHGDWERDDKEHSVVEDQHDDGDHDQKQEGNKEEGTKGNDRDSQSGSDDKN